jgi:hypothetical protein
MKLVDVTHIELKKYIYLEGLLDTRGSPLGVGRCVLYCESVQLKTWISWQVSVENINFNKICKMVCGLHVAIYVLW